MHADSLWYTSQPGSAHGDGRGRWPVKLLSTIFVLAILLAVAVWLWVKATREQVSVAQGWVEAARGWAWAA